MVRCGTCLKGRSAAITAKEVPEVVLGYMAGVVDGEGCVAIRKSRYKKRKTGEVVEYFHSQIVIVNAHRGIIELFKEYFGGHIHTREKEKSYYMQTYSWHLGHRAGIAFLKKIMPYLIVKREQARLVILCQEMNDSRIPFDQKEEIRNRQQELFYEVKELKHVA
jgi:hypothetical protein